MANCNLFVKGRWSEKKRQYHKEQHKSYGYKKDMPAEWLTAYPDHDCVLFAQALPF